MYIPCEIKLEIAKHITNMWQREKYLVALGIDHLYYESKSRPVRKDFKPFPILPKRHTYGKHVVDTLTLPIKNDKLKQQKSYQIRTRHEQFFSSKYSWCMNKIIFMRGRHGTELFSTCEQFYINSDGNLCIYNGENM